MTNLIYQKYKELFDLNEKLRKITDGILDKEFHKITLKTIFTTFMLGKAYKTHGAILFLCAQGYGEDAAILTRSLFDLLITLLYILKDPTNKRVRRYFRYDSIIRKKMFDYVKNFSTFTKLFSQPGNTTIEKVEKYAKSDQKKYKYSNISWSDKPIRQMAEEVGKGGDYQTIYYPQSNIAHSAVRTMNDYVKADDKGYTVYIGMGENWVQEDLIASLDFFLTIVKRSNKLLRLGLAKQLNSLSKRYLCEVRRVNKKVEVKNKS